MHHIREMVEGTDNEAPRLCVKFIRTENNVADIETKNVTEKTHKALVPIIKNGTFAVLIDRANREDVKTTDVLTKD